MRGYFFALVLRDSWIASVEHSSFSPGGERRTSSGDASDQTTHLGYPQDWSSRHVLMPGLRAEDVTGGGRTRPAVCLQLGDAASGGGKLAHKRAHGYLDAAAAAANQDRLGGFAGERLRAAEPISGEIPVRRSAGELQLRLRTCLG